ncbi:MAG: alpha/beta hydrolase fold domain-containing protein [Saprospiraceae bacterium]|nr:alpha/beta hydrolase fold domain-containing protein [Saprospiraceae bacterium]
MKNKYFFLLAVFFVLNVKAFGQYCTSDTRYTEVEYFDSNEITTGANIQFGIAIDHFGNPDTLLMDLYYPNLGIDTSPKRPFIMLFHGGGFSSGDKQSGDIKDLCILMARRGFVCASVNYRLGYDFTEYGQYKARYRAIQDGHAAMRFVVNNANAVRIDTSWLFVGGQSAGSLLALGMVYADQFELDSISLLYNATATSVELGKLYTSGNNLTNTYSFKGIFNNWGGITESEVDFDEMLPTIAFHGELDTTVLIDADNSFLHYTLNGSRAIHYDLISNHVCSEITIDITGGHGIFRNASSVFRGARASCFFKSVFCNNCVDFYTTDSIPSNCTLPLNVDYNSFTPNIKIFPNPVENSFKIEGVKSALDISIYNAVGQLVYKEKTYDGEVQINLMPGLYFLTIRQLELHKSYTTKLIKN